MVFRGELLLERTSIEMGSVLRPLMSFVSSVSRPQRDRYFTILDWNAIPAGRLGQYTVNEGYNYDEDRFPYDVT